MAVAPGTATDIDQVVQALRSARRITAICHENPDADTIGAAVAVVLIAERLGAEAELVSADGIPPMFAFLPRVEQARPKPQLEPDLAVVCDAANLERVGRIAQQEAEWFARAKLVNIDHHLSSNFFGDLNVVDPHAAATCEVLAEVAERLGVEPDSDLATALLTGIVRDTLGFSDRSTSAETLEIAATLVRAGAQLPEIQRRVLRELPLATLALWGHLLTRARSEAGGLIVYTVLTESMLRETHTSQHDADGVVEFLARSSGAAVVILIRELSATRTRASIRTDESVDATTIASRVGGGGHASRAGLIIDLPADAVVARLIESARAAVASSQMLSSS